MPEQNTIWTIDAMRRWTTDYFRKAGIESPQLDADILLADTLHVERIQLLIQGSRELDAETLAAFKQRVIRRAKKREPIAYILGQKEFWSLNLKVTSDTLIPRPDTECLVEAVLNAIHAREKADETTNDDAPNVTPYEAQNSVPNTDITYEALPDERLASYVEIWAEQDTEPELNDEELAKKQLLEAVDEDGKPIASRDIYDDVDKTDELTQNEPIKPQQAKKSTENALKVIDIGTGSGAIILALASELKNAELTASDISPKALAVAQQNAKELGFDQIHFVQSDLLDQFHQNFDVIVSNPPYVTDDEYEAVEPEVKCEPKTALTAGPKGLDIYERLIPQAFLKLNNRGIFAVEIGFKQGDDVKNLFEKAGFRDVCIQPDYAGNPRIVIGNKS